MTLPWPGRFAATLFATVLAGCGGGSSDDAPAAQPRYLAPVAVVTALAFEQVALGYDTSCMLSTASEAWCWGSNDWGQLGAVTTQTCAGGNVACSWQPVRAVAPLRLQALSAAQTHTCGLDAAGQAWCWGFGIGGQLGDGRSMNSRAAVAVAGNHTFVQIDAGRSRLASCALDAAGVAWCWGPSGGGALGNGTAAMANRPVQVLASQPFVSVGAGDQHACALDATGQAWCWGANLNGTLGTGVPGPALRPAPVAGPIRFASLVVGGVFNCGLTAAGAAWCWGSAGSLGVASSQHRDVPVAVAGGLVFASLSAGYQHACGLQGDGTAWCWGPADLLGGGASTASADPVAVAGGHRFRRLTAGGIATCGLTLAGVPMCWGFNDTGTVGQSNVNP